MPNNIPEAVQEGTSGEGVQPADLAEGVVSLVNAFVKGVERQISPLGLTNMEFALLKTFLEKNEWTVTGLAEVLPADAPRISRVVTRMVERGLLRRRRRTDDRRVVELRLTRDGQELIADLHERVTAHEARLLEGVSAEEKETLQTVTAKVLANHAALQ